MRTRRSIDAQHSELEEQSSLQEPMSRSQMSFLKLTIATTGSQRSAQVKGLAFGLHHHVCEYAEYDS